MRNTFLAVLAILVSSTVSIVSAQISKKEQGYTISWVNQVTIDQGNDRENYVAIFSNKDDSLTLYKWHGNSNKEPEKITFWGEKKSKSDSIHFVSSEGDHLNVAFLKDNKIQVDSDLYVVNTAYYIFLRQKILAERSILDLAFLLKDGYGDYAVYLEPLMFKNWRNQKENPAHQIIEVIVRNKNWQTEDQFHDWKAIYKYITDGALQDVKGEYYTKKRLGNKGRHVKYLIERNLDRSYIKEYSYQNRKTLMDSVSVNWTQYTTSKEFHYSRFQTRLKLINVNKKPRNFNELAKVIGI